MRRKLGWALIIIGIAAIVGGVVLFFILKNSSGAAAAAASSPLVLAKTETSQYSASPMRRDRENTAQV